MNKNIVFVCCAAAFIVGTAHFSLSQQEQARQSDPAVLQISARLDRMEQAQKQIAQKMDTVLANQQKIMAELDIIKVRATRR